MHEEQEADILALARERVNLRTTLLHEDPEVLSTSQLARIPSGTLIVTKGSSPAMYIKNDAGLFKLDSVTFTLIT